GANRRVWDHVGQTTHEYASPIFPLAAAGRYTMLEHGNQAPAISGVELVLKLGIFLV
ncbi:Hypothetical protein SMAX5B_017012, partial [Scophthalmus maximus]